MLTLPAANSRHMAISVTWIVTCAVLIQIVAPQTDLCDDGWYRNATYCYYVYEGRDITWFEARNKCIYMESDLASILNEREESFIKSISNTAMSYWIGLRKNVTWYWSDGSEFSYAHWRSDKPRANKDCTVIKKRFWRAVSCSSSDIQSFFCKKAVVATSTILMPSTAGDDGCIASYQKTTSVGDEGVTRQEMITSSTHTKDNMNKDKQMQENNSASLALPVSVGAVLCIIVIIIIVTVIIFLKRQNKEILRRNNAQVENLYTLPPVTSSDELSGNGVAREAGVTSGSADPNNQDEAHIYSEGTGSEQGRTDSTPDTGSDVTALYAVVNKPARNLSDLELHDNVNYVSLGE